MDSAINYDFEASNSSVTASMPALSDNHNSILDLNELLSTNGSVGGPPSSHRTSPYLDESALSTFVQNMNSLQISATTSNSDEHSSSHLNGIARGNSSSSSAGGVHGSSSASGGGGGTGSVASNGWW